MRYQTALERIIGAIEKTLSGTFPDGRRLYIANPHAGTRRRHRRTEMVARALPEFHGAGNNRLFRIVWSESVAETIRAIESASTDDPGGVIVVSLGGDGTHNHTLRTAMRYPSVAVLRVPLGSGNDANEFETLPEFLAALNRPLRRRRIPAVEVARLGTPEAPVVAAFNIASLGIDAFITAMHDRWRALMPGDTYRLFVDAAVLRYERLVDLTVSGLTFRDGDGSTIDAGEAVRILIAMGVSGGRTYGDHMRVLPGEENVCVLGTANLRDKLRMKRLFYEGRHVDEPLTRMYRAEELTIRYDRSLPLQLDGEAEWVRPEEFPLRFRILHDAVEVIKPE
ncbi:MAG: diacylglycerol/lipid kinase family protein [Alkalispirochaeta sp.]